MRDSSDRRIVAAAAALALAAWAAGAAALSRAEPAPPVADSPPEFDPARALETVRELVTRHPRRVLGGLEARQSSGALRNRFAAIGYTVEFGHFGAVVAGRRQVGRNVWAVRPGASSEIVAVVAHYDTAPSALQGATDNGAGVGVLLELARIAAAAPRRTLLFLASDGEEFGMLGVRDFVQTFPGRDRIVAALSLDGLAPGALAAFRLDGVGQQAGFAPSWIRELGRAAAAREGLPVETASPLRERLDHALRISWSDQGPLVAAGIPAINLGSRSRDPELERVTAHSPRDTIERLDPDSLGRYGRSAERILRTLVDLPSVPASGPDLRVAGARYLSPFWTRWLDALLFGPLAVAFALAAVRYRADLTRGALAREALDYAGVALPLALGYGAIRVAEVLRWLPRYTLYPGTLRDPVLERPAWPVISGVVAVVAGAALLLVLARRVASRSLPRPSHGASRALLLGIALGTAAAALGRNSSWAVTFLLVPAWVWALVGPGTTPGRRAGNRVLLLGAGIVWYGATVGFAAELGLGWKILWCEMLALSTGLFSGAGALLGVAAVASGLRLTAIQSLGDGR